MKTIPADKVQTLAQKPGINAYIDHAISCGKDALIVVGWLYDPDALVTGMGLLIEGRRNRFGKKTCGFRPLTHGTDNVFLKRIERQDVGKAMRGPGDESENQYGFVLIIPDGNGVKSLAFETALGRVVALPIHLLTDATEIACALEACKPHYGEALSIGMRAVFGNDDLLSRMQQRLIGSSHWKIPMNRYSAVDQVILLEGGYLIINGWIALAADELEAVSFSTGKKRVDITHRIKRYMRSDLAFLYPWSVASDALGFLCLLHESHGSPETVMITVRTVTGDEQTHECAVIRADWNSLTRMICEHQNDLSLAMIQLLDELHSGQDGGQYRTSLSGLRRNNIREKHGVLGAHIESPGYVFANVDRGIPLGADGLLVFGWYLGDGRKPESVKTYDGNGQAVTAQLVPLLRRDVVDAYGDRMQGLSAMCGFACLVPLATRAGDLRVLGFDYGELGEAWMKIPTDRPTVTGINLARDMIGMIPEPMSMSHKLYDLFDHALGPAIQSVTRRTNAETLEVTTRQFGVPPEQVAWSVIVPLYGRCDFMRYQLSHFADDPDFRQCDLIYVVDDPELVSPALALAARYQPLFGIPFRVLWYGENRGFAGANNIGVEHARSDSIVLMNSDVLPQQHGWLGTLANALNTLDRAGAVGPLLEFADGSIQHAGMRPFQDAALPGFLLNSHVHMGTAWEGGDQPAEQIMLTAACLMLSRESYLSAGGLDEGYLIGDFEDSDLCLSLRKLGYRLWLVPEARLWHLERQSVSLHGAATSRQMITLYNGWRYRQKMLRGDLVDPRTVEVAE